MPVERNAMQLRTRTLAVLFFTLCVQLFSSECFALVNKSREKDSKVPPTRIQLNVKAERDLDTQIRSYFIKELGAIEGIVITQDGPEWIISAIAIEDTLQTNVKIGYTISIVVLRVFDNKAIQGWFKDNFRDVGDRITSDLYKLEDHWVCSASPDGLPDACKRAAERFHGYLEDYRKFLQKYRSPKGR
jgi:hypothetical protein